MLSFHTDEEDDDLPAVSEALGKIEDIRERFHKPPTATKPLIASKPLIRNDLKPPVKSESSFLVNSAFEPISKPTASPGIASFINRFKRAQLNPVEKVKQAKWSNRLSAEQLSKIASTKPILTMGDDDCLEVSEGQGEKEGIFGSRNALLQRAHVPRVKRASIDKLNDVLDKRIRLKQDEVAKARRPVAIQQDACLFDPTILRKDEIQEDKDGTEEEEASEEIEPEAEMQDFEETGLLPKRKIMPLLSDTESDEDKITVKIKPEADIKEEESAEEEMDLIDTLAELDEEEPKRKWKASDFFDEEAESDEEDSEDGEDEEKGKTKQKKKKPKVKSVDEQIDEKAIEEELSGFIAAEEEEEGEEDSSNLYQVHQKLEQKDDEARLAAIMRRFGNPADGMTLSASRIEAKYKRKAAVKPVEPQAGSSAFRMLIQEDLHEAIKYSDHLCGQDDDDYYYYENEVEDEDEVVERTQLRETFTIDLTEEVAAVKRGNKKMSTLQMDARVAERIQQNEQ